MTESIRLLVGTSRAAYIGPGLDLTPHANIATTVMLSLDQPAQLRQWSARGEWGAWCSCHTAVIPGGTLHHLRSSGRMLFLYLDPLSDDAQAIDADCLQTACLTLAKQAPQDLTTGGIADLIGIPAKPFQDLRLLNVLLKLESQPESFASIETAARQVHLSASRFRARFAEAVGLPFRRYRLWRKMARVATLIAAGQSLTDAALDAGFSDSTHLSSTFRRMFGIAPGFLLDPRVSIVCEPPVQTRIQQAA